MTRVDVAFVRVEPGIAEHALVIGDLSMHERIQVGRLGMGADRDRRATGYVAARRELGRRLGMHPRRVPLALSRSGQPLVEGCAIGISWSHSGLWVALAVSLDGPVGVDIEQRPEKVPVRALRALGLSSLEEFVGREAAGKATGQGLMEMCTHGVLSRLLRAPPGYVAAVAAFREPLSVQECGVLEVGNDGRRGPAPAHQATLTQWGYPSGVSWTGSRLSLRGPR